MSAFTVKKTITSEEKPPVKAQELAVSGSPTKVVDAGMRTALLKDTTKRVQSTVTKENLELLYRIDGLTFRIVQKYKEKILGYGYVLKDGTAESRKLCDAFCKNIGLSEIMDQVINDIFVTGNGNAWTELGYSKDGLSIVKLKTINPKSGMDYIRNADGDIEYDNTITPVGYQMTGSFGYPEMKWYKSHIEAENKTVWTADADEDGRDRIAHWTLITNGETCEGISPLEPVYKACMIRMNLEDTVGNAAFRSMSLAAYVGSENEDPMTVTDEQLDGVKNKLQSIDQDTVWAFRRNVELKDFPIPDIRNYERLLYYLADLQSSGAGIPLSLILEPADASSRGEMTDKKSELMDSVKNFQSILSLQIRENLFKRLLRTKNKPEESAPFIRFNITEPTMALSTARRLSTYARYGLLTPSIDVEQWIREQENLPPVSEENKKEINKIKESKMRPPTKQVVPTTNQEKKTVNKKGPREDPTAEDEEDNN